MLLQVISFRIYRVYENKVNARAKQIWRPILADMMLFYPENIPSLQKKHRHVFLREWNLVYSILRGDANVRLQVLSRHKRLDNIAHRYINSRNMRKQLQGIVTLGHMQDYSVWNKLIDFVNAQHPILSMTAAQALVDIDSKNAMRFLVPHIIKRRDWPVARVAMMLNSASTSELAMLLEQAIEKAPTDDIPYILGFLASTHFDPEISKLCKRLGKSQDSRVIAACIDAAKDAHGLELARKNASNPLWYIRLHVARALGRLGTKADIPVLTQLMSDPEWWVRYRSAQSIAQMPFINANDLEKLHDQLDDRYARDILQQAISERQWA
jgi:HEAT repeat protein